MTDVELEKLKGHTPGPIPMRYDWDVTGYPCYFVLGLAGEDKRHEAEFAANVDLFSAAPVMRTLSRLYR